MMAELQVAKPAKTIKLNPTQGNGTTLGPPVESIGNAPPRDGVPPPKQNDASLESNVSPQTLQSNGNSAGQSPATGSPTVQPADASTNANIQAVPETARPEAKAASRFAALAKQQKALWEQQKAIKAEREAISRDLEEIRYERRRFDELRKKPPLQAVKEAFGWTYDDLTQSQLAGGETPPSIEVKEVKNEIEQLRLQREKDRQDFARAEARRRQNDAARAKAEVDEEISTWAEDVNQFVRNNAKEYKLLNRNIQTGVLNRDIVPQVIDAHYWQTAKMNERGEIIQPGRILSEKEACENIEKWLKEQYKAGLEDFEPEELSEYVKGKYQAVKGQQSDKYRTVHNGLTASTHPPSSSEFDYSEEGRVKAALAAAERYEKSQR